MSKQHIQSEDKDFYNLNLYFQLRQIRHHKENFSHV